jgi:serine/threonine protein kinase
MAPEVAKRQNHGPTADFFALGVIMYEFIVGERPYNSCERDDLIREIDQGDIKI